MTIDTTEPADAPQRQPELLLRRLVRARASDPLPARVRGPASATLTLAVLVAMLCAFLLVLSGCGMPAPAPLIRHPAPAPVAPDPAHPCSRPAAPAAPGGAATAATATFDGATITLTGGENVTPAALAAAAGAGNALREVAPGEWLLTANVRVARGASLTVAAPEVRWLKLASTPTGFVSLSAFGGGLTVTGTCITSWDQNANTVDTRHEDGRSYLLARDGATMRIDRSELRYLGNGEVESYGVSWRTAGTTGSITDSVVSHNYFGLYSHGIEGLVVTGNEIYGNHLYGVDPHTGSHHMTIERNTVHDNGKHGIILAEDCHDSVIRDNTVYRNAHHGIVLYLRSDRNVVEGNESFGNAAQGININDSGGNTVRGNRAYDNQESGIGVTQTAGNNLVERNEVRANLQDGVRVVSEAHHTTLRDNTLGENGRYGVYVDVDGAVEITGNTIFGNRSGIMLKGTAAEPRDNTIFDNAERAVISG